MKEINPATPLTPEARAEIAALATRQRAAAGLLMRAIQSFGGKVEGGMKALPAPVRQQLDQAALKALKASYEAAGLSRNGRLGGISGTRAHKALAAVSGALGGLGGLPTALAELPVATTVIFRAVQDVAARHGEDPTTPEVRAECLQVFGAGGPGDADDGLDTAFFGARVALTGPALHGLLAKVAPRFAAVLGQKLAGQAVPLLGAVAGAGTNFVFVDYYTALAEVHFGLRRLSRTYGPDQVAEAFHAR